MRHCSYFDLHQLLCLSNLKQLSVLDLSGNLIEKIHEKAFSQVSSLRQLDLQDNQLYRVPGEAFKSLTMLESLNIGQNKFSVIDENAFSNLKRLKRIKIAKCPSLKEIRKNAFEHQEYIEKVIISLNPLLVNIDHEVFDKTYQKMEHLDLHGNALTKLPLNLLLSFPSLSYLDMSSNPWYCDCKAQLLSQVDSDLCF